MYQYKIKYIKLIESDDIFTVDENLPLEELIKMIQEKHSQHLIEYNIRLVYNNTMFNNTEIIKDILPNRTVLYAIFINKTINDYQEPEEEAYQEDESQYEENEEEEEANEYDYFNQNHEIENNMQQLNLMGYNNNILNRRLLMMYNNNIDMVVNYLLDN
jgi:hypothetical protein